MVALLSYLFLDQEPNRKHCLSLIACLGSLWLKWEFDTRKIWRENVIIKQSMKFFLKMLRRFCYCLSIFKKDCSCQRTFCPSNISPFKTFAVGTRTQILRFPGRMLGHYTISTDRTQRPRHTRDSRVLTRSIGKLMFLSVTQHWWCNV